MGMNYANATKLWASRRKSLDYKAWKNDTHITIGENSEMLFTYIPFTYVNNPTTGGWKRTRCKGTPLAVITPDNILTLLAETSFKTQTINNRLFELLGCSIYSDTRRHRTKESAVRISTRYFDSKGGNIPYKPGIQFQMDSAGYPSKVLNPPEDRARHVKKDRIHEVSKQTADMRKLMVAMARLGSFDEAAKSKAESRYVRWAAAKTIDTIDVTSPMGEDAKALFIHGLHRTNPPDRGHWDGRTFSEISIEARIEQVKTRAINKGMQLLRQRIYESSDGYEIVPVKQPTKE